jgi:hypothetical protein
VEAEEAPAGLQKRPGAVVGTCGLENREGSQIGLGQGDAAKPFGLQADETDDPRAGARRRDGLDPHRLIEERPSQRLPDA